MREKHDLINTEDLVIDPETQDIIKEGGQEEDSNYTSLKALYKYEKEQAEYEFFQGGPFSQWYKSDFIDLQFQDIIFNTAEQYMMYNKARLFFDREVADKILNIRDAVYKGNYLKFTQNLELKELLLTTKGKLLVEASPYNKIWGIGLSIKDTIGNA